MMNKVVLHALKEKVKKIFPSDDIFFCNGGDRNKEIFLKWKLRALIFYLASIIGIIRQTLVAGFLKIGIQFRGKSMG